MNGHGEPGARLSGRGNPRSGLDFVVMLTGTTKNGMRVRIRFVPDKLLLDASVLDSYLGALPTAARDAPEGLALAVLDDINNDIVPRWVQIVVDADVSSGGGTHAVVVEDRQPNWENTAILANLPSL